MNPSVIISKFYNYLLAEINVNYIQYLQYTVLLLERLDSIVVSVDGQFAEGPRFESRRRKSDGQRSNY